MGLLRKKFEASRRVGPKVTENKESKKWCAQGYDFRTFLGEFVAAVTRLEVPPAMSL
jgi:hypothetical protein